jgi:hypothetical protein
MLAAGDTSNYADHLGKILSYEKTVFPENLRSRAQNKFEETRMLLSTIKNKHTAIK